MATFTSFDGTEIAFDVRGDGRPVLLHHGFAADAATNWERPGIVDALAAAGRQVITIDARGHGRSGKPHDPAAYRDAAMVTDARGLLDHLGVDGIDIVGYSMGSFVAARLAAGEPRARRLILGGVGARMLRDEPVDVPDVMAATLEADEVDDALAAASPQAAGFRRFADRTGADRRALAACLRAGMWSTPVRWSDITVPTLVLAGDRDDLAAGHDRLAAAIAGAETVVVPGDHLGAVGEPAFTAAIVEFLGR